MEICEKSGSTILLLEKSRVDMVNIPLFTRVSCMLYTYPIIYQGFIHNISHYVPGVLYIYPKRVVVLKRDFFSR